MSRQTFKRKVFKEFYGKLNIEHGVVKVKEVTKFIDSIIDQCFEMEDKEYVNITGYVFDKEAERVGKQFNRKLFNPGEK